MVTTVGWSPYLLQDKSLPPSHSSQSLPRPVIHLPAPMCWATPGSMWTRQALSAAGSLCLFSPLFSLSLMGHDDPKDNPSCQSREIYQAGNEPTACIWLEV